MFERFTDRARRVVVLAQEEARLLNHNYIGTEHILLGLIHEGDGVAAQALTSLGISFDAVRDEIEEIIGRGESVPSGHIPFTPRAKKVLEMSLREALQLGHNYIGTEHILLGLIHEGEGVAAQVLVRKGAELTRVRQQVIQLLSGYSAVTEKTLATTDDPQIRSSRPPATPGREREHRLFVDLLRASEEIRAATLEALVALWDADDDQLRERLAELVRMATLSGDAALLDRLLRIVDIDDAETGQVRLKPRPDGEGDVSAS